MKKILIATSALTALTLTPALALDLKTSGVVEYFVTSDDTVTVDTARVTVGSLANLSNKSLKKKPGNQTLSQKQAHVKFAASGMARGLSYGAYVQVGNGTNTANRKKVDVPLNAMLGDEIIPVPTGVTASPWATASAGAAVQGALVKELVKLPSIADATAAKAALRGKSVLRGYTQKGQAVVWGQSKTGNDTKIWAEGIKAPYNLEQTKANSGMWVSGSFGKVILNQHSSAAQNAFMGDVKAARFFPSSLVSDPRGSHRTLHDTGMERITYESPEMNGLQVSFTKALKGNVSTNKMAKPVGPQNHAVTYKTEMGDTKIKLFYAGGRDKGGTKGLLPTEAPSTDYTPYKYKADAPKGTTMGGEVAYGKFTVGYNKFTNKKRYYQKKNTGGSIYGVRYFNKFYAIGYTVIQSEDKNTYAGHHASKGDTKALTASLWIDKGFNFYMSRATNNVTFKGLGTRLAPKTVKGKQTHTMFGMKATF